MPYYFSHGQLARMAAERGLWCQTGLDFAIHDPVHQSRRAKTARAIYRLPGGRFALEAVADVVRVRLQKPA